MSPTKMFHSCGSSSIAVAAQQSADPRDARIVLAGLDRAGARFGIRDHRTELQRREHAAIRGRRAACGKNTGPPSSSLIAAAISAQSGADTIRPTPESATSNRALHHAARATPASRCEELVIRRTAARRSNCQRRFARARCPSAASRRGSSYSRRNRVGERVGIARRREQAAADTRARLPPASQLGSTAAM